MKNLFTFCLLVAPLLSGAQNLTTVFSTPSSTSANQTRSTNVERGGLLYWSEYFANGMNSTNGLWTQSGADTIWKHSYYTTSGEWSFGTPEFAGPTEADGFMLFDADSVNFPISPNYLSRSGSLTSPYIDLTGASNVVLEYNQQFRYCCSSPAIVLLSVSTDSGATWTDFDASHNLPTSSATPNPDLVSINVSGLVDNEPAVLLKFTFGGPGISHYYYIMDDVELSQGTPYDATITDAFHDDFAEYYTYPDMHFQAFEFSATISNLGVDSLPNAFLQVDVYNDQGTLEHTEVSTPQTIGGPTLMHGQSTFFPNWATSYYDLVFTTQHDSIELVSSNDSIVHRMWYSFNEYVRDNGELGNSITNGPNSFECGNVFEIINSANLECINFYVDSLTDVGSTVYGVVYQFDTITGNIVYWDQTPDYMIQSNDVGNWVVLQFLLPIYSPGNEMYICAVGSYGGNEELHMRSATNPARPNTSFFLDGIDNTWYFLGEVPMVRLAFGFTHSIEEDKRLPMEVQLYPNPANNFTTISCDITETGPLTVELFDQQGKLLYLEEFEAKKGQQFTTEIKTSDLAPGIYHVQLSNRKSMATQQLTIQ